MENTISSALFLLAIGMITVFIILMLVILCGKLLITVVNKYLPEEEKIKRESADDKAKHVIQQIVNKVTNSKGVIEKIEKL